MGFQIEELSERIISTDVKESDFSTLRKFRLLDNVSARILNS
jgi:hypothetical protein